jgi:hypothetical protein
MTSTSRFLFPLFILYFSLTLIIFLLTGVFEKYAVDRNILLYANSLFLLINIVVFIFQKKAFSNPNPNVFVRSVIGGMMLKMFVCAMAVIAYVVLVGPTYNTKSVFISLFFYLFYLAAEVAILMRLNNKKNA